MWPVCYMIWSSRCFVLNVQYVGGDVFTDLLLSAFFLPAVRKAVESLDVPMWEPTGEKIDLSEGEEKKPEEAAEQKEAEEVGVFCCFFLTLDRATYRLNMIDVRMMLSSRRFSRRWVRICFKTGNEARRGGATVVLRSGYGG